MKKSSKLTFPPSLPSLQPSPSPSPLTLAEASSLRDFCRLSLFPTVSALFLKSSSSRISIGRKLSLSLASPSSSPSLSFLSRFHSSSRLLQSIPKQMDYYAKIISSRTVDTEPSLVLRFPTSQYLFNVGEGTQRIFQETNSSTKRIEGVFLTGLSTEEAGGLSGE